ncbi:MAG: hypothetical protein AAGU77_06050 [Bacillota bacterium]
MKKRFVCMLLCLFLLFGAFPTASLANAPLATYDDVVTAAGILDAIRDDADFAGLYLTDNQTGVVVSGSTA